MVRQTRVILPTNYRGTAGNVVVRHEEEAICSLWGSSSCFPWDRDITWLYTPVVGNRRWPGDLWGVDDHGDLLVIEAKQAIRNDDPFKDFLAFHAPGREEFSAAHWRRKWRRHLKAELRFPDGFHERPKNKTVGILPRSNKRKHLRRWPELAAAIDRHIRSPCYAADVDDHLRVRAKRGDPTPYYFALMVLSGTRNLVLSQAAAISAQQLRQLVGPDRVAVVGIGCTAVQGGQAIITAHRIAFSSDPGDGVGLVSPTGGPSHTDRTCRDGWTCVIDAPCAPLPPGWTYRRAGTSHGATDGCGGARG